MPTSWQSLISTDGLKLLQEAENELDSGTTELTVGSRLRASGVEPDLVAAVLTQAGLRKRAQVKFGDGARKYLFTAAGLEQASRSRVASAHASRFKMAGCTRVADLGCGIGTESLALLSVGVDVLAVELDSLTAQLAAHNLAAGSKAGTALGEVLNADATAVTLDQIDGVFLDPARRTAGHRNTRRITSPDDFSPSLNFAFGLAARLPTGIKLGPGFERELIPYDAEAQWVSVNGQVVETGLWFGAVARPEVRRAALVIRGDELHELTAAADSPDVEVRSLGEYLYEPDGAVIRGRLIGKLAEEHLHAGMLSEGIAYLTGDTLIETPFAQAFRIIEQLPASEKQLKRALVARNIGQLEIKKRGIDVDPAILRKKLQLKGTHPATLIMTRVDGKHTALLAERA